MRNHGLKVLLMLGVIANILAPSNLVAKPAAMFEACEKKRCGDVQYCKNLGGNACTCAVNPASGPHCHSMQAEE